MKKQLLLIIIMLINYSAYSKIKNVTLEIPQSIIDNCKTKIVDNNDIDGIQIFPNPSTGKFLIQIPGVLKMSNLDIKVQNMLGKTVNFTNNKILISQNTITIDLSDCITGLYIVSIINGNKYYSSKLVLK